MLPGSTDGTTNHQDGLDSKRCIIDTNDENVTHQGFGGDGFALAWGEQYPSKVSYIQGQYTAKGSSQRKRRKVGRMLMTTMPKQVKDRG